MPKQTTDQVYLTAIIPMFNAQNFIEKTIKSITSQTLRNIEIIIVDDASTDNSNNIVTNLAKQDNRIKLIKLEKNYGSPSYPRNIGVSNAHGNFVTFVDADDTIDETMYETMYSFAIKTQSDIVVCGYKEVDENNNILKIVNFNSTNITFQDILNNTLNPATWNKIYKTNLFTKNNIQFQHKIFCEDLGNTHELFYFAKKISLVEQPLYNYLILSQSASHKKINQKYINDIFIALDTTYKFLIKQKIFNQYKVDFFIRYIKQLSFLYTKIIKDNELNLIPLLRTFIKTNNFFSQLDLKDILKQNIHIFLAYNILLKYLNIPTTLLDNNMNYFISSIKSDNFMYLQAKVYSLLNKKINQVFIYGYGAAFDIIKKLLQNNNIQIIGIIESQDHNRNLSYPYGSLETFLSQLNNKTIFIISTSFYNEISTNIKQIASKHRLNINII